MPSGAISGKDITLTLNTTTVSHWTRWTFSEQLDTADAAGATDAVNYQVTTRKSATLTVEGFEWGDQGLADLLDIGDELTAYSATGLKTNLLTTYGKAKVTRIEMNADEGPQSWSLEITFGIQDYVAV